MTSIMIRKQTVDTTSEKNELQSKTKLADYQTLTGENTYTIDDAIDTIGFGKFQLKLGYFAGMCCMADAMEIMVLAVLSPVLHCEWRINTVQQALLTAFVFVGMMIGAIMWGKIADVYGRKSAIFMCTVYTAWFGVLSAFSPNYLWLLILRTAVGMGIGGVAQAFIIYSEFLPTKYRYTMVFGQVFWSLGTIMIVLMAMFVMPKFGWRYLMLAASFPFFTFTILCWLMPESIRYQYACGDVEGVKKTLSQMARDNGQPLPAGRLVSPVIDSDTIQKRGRFADLFKVDLKVTTSVLMFIWGFILFLYYGLILMSTELYKHAEECTGNSFRTTEVVESSCNLDCKSLDRKDYINLLWTSSAELPALFISLVLIELVGRKTALGLELLCFTAFSLILGICIPVNLLTLLLSLARAFISAATLTLYVYTTEVYPTEVRAIGLGLNSATARIGVMITPFVAQVILERSTVLAISIYGIVAFVLAFSSVMLPIETKGRDLDSK